MKKSNIRSMRFSDTMIEMIEAQAGDTFTAKFEALVTRCMWELPEKEKRIAELDKQIEQKRKELKELWQSTRQWRSTLQAINGRLMGLETLLDNEVKMREP